MDTLDKLIAEFNDLPPGRAVASGTGENGLQTVLAIIDFIHKSHYVLDSRLVDLFLTIISDKSEYDLSRVEVLKILEFVQYGQQEHERFGHAIVQVALDKTDNYLVRWWVAQSMARYLDMNEVIDALIKLVLNPEEDDVVRTNVFSVVEQLGPTDQNIEVMRMLLQDEELKKWARSALSEWRVATQKTLDGQPCDSAR